MSLSHVIQPHLLQLFPCTSAILTFMRLLSSLCTVSTFNLELSSPNVHIAHTHFILFSIACNKLPQIWWHNAFSCCGPGVWTWLRRVLYWGLTRLQPRCYWAAVSSEAQMGKICFSDPSNCCRIQLSAAMRPRPILLLTAVTCVLTDTTQSSCHVSSLILNIFALRIFTASSFTTQVVGHKIILSWKIK